MIRLTQADDNAINAIISNLTVEQKEEIRDRVEAMVESSTRNPFISAMEDYKPDSLTKTIYEYLSESDMEYQQKLSDALRELTMMRVTREYAAEQHLHGMKYWEVA
ncbi:hypothetical protein CIG19_16725 [Enterobacterales bacterium CwR94]|nr:hypothetical protein CIG19_16725 [Enterobacterales bacterium CwR94]